MALITNESVLKGAICVALRNMSNSFGGHFKLTLVARHPSDDNAFAVFSEDDHLEKVIETIQKQIKKKEVTHDFSKPANGNG